ncbi:MAG TPA: hypothetical protein ENI85_18705 [Deltaproteobacteria bacterium]|nr:hypothetical protein [Deltaproteobacteria bacterium]
MNLIDRIEGIARALADREAAHVGSLTAARETAERIHARVEEAIHRFNDIVGEKAPHLRVEVRPPRVDDKHLHAVEFDLERGRHRAVVTVKSKGEITFVGPFRQGKKEGPCLTFPVDDEEEIDAALGVFLERFLEEAASP